MSPTYGKRNAPSSKSGKYTWPIKQSSSAPSEPEPVPDPEPTNNPRSSS